MGPSSDTIYSIHHEVKNIYYCNFIQTRNHTPTSPTWLSCLGCATYQCVQQYAWCFSCTNKGAARAKSMWSPLNSPWTEHWINMPDHFRCCIKVSHLCCQVFVLSLKSFRFIMIIIAVRETWQTRSRVWTTQKSRSPTWLPCKSITNIHTFLSMAGKVCSQIKDWLFMLSPLSISCKKKLNALFGRTSMIATTVL